MREEAGNPGRLFNIDVAGTHQGCVDARQDPPQALISDGTLREGGKLTRDRDVACFTSENAVTIEPISTNIDPPKAGPGGEGDDMIIGGTSCSDDVDCLAPRRLANTL